MKILTFGKVKDDVTRFVKEKRTALLVAAGIAGILLLLVSDLAGGKEEKSAGAAASFDNDAYNAQFVAQLETDLKNLLLSVEGTGDVEVKVTLETGVRYVLAKNEKTSSDVSQKSEWEYSEQLQSQSDIIIIDGKDGEEPIILQRVEPVVQGVVVVCEGASDIFVKQSVVEIVTTLCGVSANRVSVVQMTKSG